MNTPKGIVPPARKGSQRPTGAGAHGDRRLRRQRNRGAARRAAIASQDQR